MRNVLRCLIILVSAFTAACDINEQVVGGEPSEKVLHYGNGGDPKTIDPNKQSLVLEGNIMYALFEGLVTDGPDGSVQPGQAERWDVSEDGLTYTFYLREGLQWSDGSRVTAHDFEYSFKRLVDPMTAAELAFAMYALKNAEAIVSGEMSPEALGVEVVDDLTLVLTLGKPQPALIHNLKSVQGLPLPRHIVEQHGKDWTDADKIVSNGAYVFRGWQVGNRLEIEKNPKFRDAENVAIERVFFYPTEDAEAALRRVRAGELHIDRNFPMARTRWLMENMPEYMHTHPYLGSYMYVLNVQKPPLDDVRVRRALSMVVDRETIVRAILNDLGYEPAYSLVPPTMGGWSMPATPEWVDWSMEERQRVAREMLAEAGFNAANPLSLNVSYNTDEGHKRIAIAISKMWEAIGVNAVLENFEFRVHTDNVNQGNFEVARRGWIGIEGMPEFFLGLFESRNIPLNGGRWNFPEYDATLNGALGLVNSEERNAMFRQADEILQREAPMIPIYFYVSRNLVSPRVTGWVDNPGDDHPIHYMDLLD